MNQAASETADRERLPYFYKHILFGSVSGCEINVSISMATKRKLACLTAEQKKESSVFHGNNTNKKQQEIADIFSIIKALHQWAPSPGVTLVNTIKPATGLLGLFVYLATSLLAIIWLWPKCGEITGYDCTYLVSVQDC